MEDTIKRITEKLNSENTEWVKQVFSATGVLCEYSDEGYIRLMSLCGDESIPYDWPDDELSNVDSIDSFIEYIKASELYTERLQDVSYGSFTKEELLDIDCVIHAVKEQDESMIPEGVYLAPETDDVRISILTETAELMEYIKHIHSINQEQYKA